jgi:hypothetical protein
VEWRSSSAPGGGSGTRPVPKDLGLRWKKPGHPEPKFREC